MGRLLNKFSVVLVLTLTSLSPAQTNDARAKIEYGYLRATKAVSLKFFDGIISVRTPDYELLDPEGSPVSLAVERIRMEGMMNPAISVSERYTIESYEQPSASRARCKVQYITTVITPEPGSRRPLTMVMVTRCLDDWLLTEKGWKLARTHVTSQTMQRTNIRPAGTPK
jgi:hypothetical protein